MEKSEEIIKVLKSKLSKKSWEMWFGTFSVKNVSETLITFSVGNIFIKDWLNQKYHKQFKETIKEVFGRDVPYVIEDELASEEATKEKKKTERLIRKRPVVYSEFNKEYTFENFVVGPFNEEAYDGTLEVAKDPGKMNPFFVYGGVGLGKTHLLHAMGNYLIQNSPDVRVMYVTAEKFMNDLVMAIRNNSTQEFRKNFREKIDVLIIDDIQFLMGKNGIQSELFHTLNHLLDHSKQIVLCSDRTPTQLSEFQPRLVSRFQMGLVVKVYDPDIETAMQIARTFAQRNGLLLSNEMAREIALSSDNVRTIKGIVTKLAFKSMKSGVNADTVANAVRDVVGKGVSLKGPASEKEAFFQVLSGVFDVLPAELDAKIRTANLSRARQIGMYFARKYLHKTFSEIGTWFARDHSSVVYSCKKVEESLRKGNSKVREKVFLLQKLLRKQSGESAG
ncbi:chromosomal replication initiator protein DnaA [Mesoaciditoga lauensis]|uniref:chromosomal replication initiator protein DnaA n=1 Tax=Mesoaciditoga lauensis TaxID=1495039 RepID=UPI000564AA5D|nr:chromosomal replication initiator protein DnaA [Mesoaciditoga lauensis]